MPSNAQIIVNNGNVQAVIGTPSPTIIINSGTTSGGGGSFTLTNGNGTTAAGTAVNLGGTLTHDTSIDGGAIYSLNFTSTNVNIFNADNTVILSTGATGTSYISVLGGWRQTLISDMIIDANTVEGENLNIGQNTRLNNVSITGKTFSATAWDDFSIINLTSVNTAQTSSSSLFVGTALGGADGLAFQTTVSGVTKVRVVVTTGGVFKFLTAVAPVVGQVPTATNVDGTWTWQTPSSGFANPMTTTGDLIQSNPASTPTRLAAVATGNALISGGVGVISSWGKITSAHVDATVALTASSWQVTGTSTFTGAVLIDETVTGGSTLKFKAASLGVTPVDGKGAWFYNDAVAAAGAQQISPDITWEGQGWATTPVASQSVKFHAHVLPVQGAANPSATWSLAASINGGAYGNALTLNQLAAGTGTLSTYGLGITNINAFTEFMTLTNTFFESSSTTIAGDRFIFTAANATKYTATSGVVTEVRLGMANAGFAPTSGTATFNSLIATHTINQTGGANGQITTFNGNITITAAVNVTGFDWNPITPANITGTHLAFRATSGNVLIGATTITASTQVDIRGTGTTTNKLLRLADSGNALRFTMLDNGSVGFFGVAAAAQQTSGANLTNNVTVGGTNDQIDDFTSLTVYATDAAAIRNDIYQLARKLKQVNDALRLFGFLT